MGESTRAAYEARQATLRGVAQDLEAQSTRISSLRGVTALGAIVPAAWALFRPLPAWGWAAAGLSAVAFVVLVARHMALVTRAAAAERRARIVGWSLSRVARRWDEVTDRGSDLAVTPHGYAGDLDLFGPASLFCLVNACSTREGRRTLARWLVEPADAATVAARQAAARDFAERAELREDLAVLGSAAAARGDEGRAPTTAGADPMLGWAASAGAVLGLPTALFVACAGGVLVTASLFALSRSGLLGAGLASRAWVGALVAQGLVLLALRPRLEAVLGLATAREAPFGRYAELLARLEGERLSPGLGADRIAALRSDSGATASAEMRRLERIVGFAELRHNAIVYVLVNIATLWDLWCALALDRWRQRAGRRVAAWLEIVGELEALSSLGALAAERPAWCWPVVDGGTARFEAEGLGHPLIDEEHRVDNDVTLPEPGRALMVTGSNMSGKSTLLRSMGLAAVMAQAGAPVCARRLSMSALTVRTSMRIDDSLARGVSHFYAEVERLKGVVDAAASGRPLLFLLDEVLHGTNSRERRIGAKAVVKKLLGFGALGAVSSHDLGLADLEGETAGHVVNVHLEEKAEGGKMTFDYVVRPGPVKSGNALLLMRQVGLDVPLE